MVTKFLGVLFAATLSVAHQVSGSSFSSDFYTGAVVEYNPIIKSPEETMVLENAKKYAEFMKEAKARGADIIVFPGYALRTITIASPIPEPSEKIAPCNSTTFVTTKVVKELSCASKEYAIYSVVNLREKRNCTDKENCPAKGYQEFVTNVVFDRNGTVVARYSKFNLYDEGDTSKTTLPEISFFDTDFGVRFGTFVSFDILFGPPALTLVQKHNITDFVFTNLWHCELPFLSALQVQGGWAESNNINLLAAGFNNPSAASGGSGIYNGKFGALVEIMPEKKTNQLLVATIPKIKNTYIRQTEREMPVSVEPQILSFPSDSYDTVAEQYGNEDEFKVRGDQIDRFTTVIIPTGKRFQQKICSNKFCCSFNVTIEKLKNDTATSGYVHRALVFDGRRSFGKSFLGGVQVCGVVLCDGPSPSNCVNRAKNSTDVFRMSEIQIEGLFQSADAFQIPSTLTDVDKELLPLSANKYDFTKVKVGDQNKISLELDYQVNNLLTFGIWGRNFRSDIFNSSVSVVSSSILVLLSIVVAFFGH